MAKTESTIQRDFNGSYAERSQELYEHMKFLFQTRGLDAVLSAMTSVLSVNFLEKPDDYIGKLVCSLQQTRHDYMKRYRAVFDWHKAAQLIRAHRVVEARACGSNGPEFQIWEDGRPAPLSPGFFLQISNDDAEDIELRVGSDLIWSCHRPIVGAPWGPADYWPQSAIEVVEGRAEWNPK